MDRYVPLPPLPARVSRLNELAYDLWWSWNPGAREVFRDLDYPLWRFTDHNPVLLLHLVEPERLDFAAADESFLQLYDRAVASLDAIRSGTGTWWSRTQPESHPLAWVTTRFALHQSLPGRTDAQAVAAGDFVKEASDLGLPFVGVGLMYGRAYPHQRMTPEGWQQDAVEHLDWSDAPITPAVCADGSFCEFAIALGRTEVSVAVWQVRAGRSRVYLLDTDLPGNAPWDRELSSRHCEGDADAMLRQSALLAAGAVEALARLGITPAAWCLAGSSSAMVILERLNRLVHEGEQFLNAVARVRDTTRFTSRSDVPTAQESCSFGALERHLASTWPALVPHGQAVLAMGHHETDRTPVFNRAVLAARHCGAVSVAVEGVHLSSWVSGELTQLFEEHVDKDWRDRQMDSDVWTSIAAIPDEALWGARQRLRGFLVDFMRERARRRWAREQAGGSGLVALGTLFDAQSLTIGCAPRFPDGGTGGELFRDVDRLARIVADARRPVQLVIAGRADAGDDIGKHHLQQTFRHAMDAAFGGRVAFVEDYDLHVARLLVQGCDVWLCPPPYRGGPSLAAAKAAVNGVPLLGTRAAWYSGPVPGTGWLAEDARTLYSVLEDQIVPAFYERDRRLVPERWVGTIRTTLATALASADARRALIALANSAPISA
jgi:starch phosphorylase